MKYETIVSQTDMRTNSTLLFFYYFFFFQKKSAVINYSASDVTQH